MYNNQLSKLGGMRCNNDSRAGKNKTKKQMRDDRPGTAKSDENGVVHFQLLSSNGIIIIIIIFNFILELTRVEYVTVTRYARS